MNLLFLLFIFIVVYLCIISIIRFDRELQKRKNSQARSLNDAINIITRMQRLANEDARIVGYHRDIHHVTVSISNANLTHPRTTFCIPVNLLAQTIWIIDCPNGLEFRTYDPPNWNIVFFQFYNKYE